MIAVLDLFSCIGCQAIGLADAGPFETVCFVEINPFRQAVLERRFAGVPVHGDIRTFNASPGLADLVVGGPPCQRTSTAAAIHGKRDGGTLWPEMFRVVLDVRPQWVVVEQPPGNADWETIVAGDLRDAGFFTARVSFSARDVGADYPRRRVFILASPAFSRLEIAWAAVPSAIGRVKGFAHARGAWDTGVLGTIRVDARSAGEMERSESRFRRQRVGALGDSNPPAMMEVIGLAIAEAMGMPA